MIQFIIEVVPDAAMKLKPSPVLPPLPEAEFQALRASIGELGVLVPLQITDDGTIIDGHERHKVIVELGIRRFPMRVVGGLSEEQRRELAVRLNVERRHLTPAQRRQLIEAELRADPARSDRALGDLFRCSHNTVGAVRSRLEANGQIDRCSRSASDGRVFKPPSVGVETLQAAREAGRLLQSLGDDVQGGLTIRDARKAAWTERYRQASNIPSSRLPVDIKIKHCDFRRLPVVDGSVDLILTDPPWDQHHRHLLNPMCEVFERWLRPGGLLMCYVGTQAMCEFMAAFTIRLQYQWTFAGIKSAPQFVPPEGRFVPPGGSYKAGGKFLSCWRPAILFSKGAVSSVLKSVSDVLILGGPEKELHPWQQTLVESRYFVANLTPPGALIVDPFIGSGTNAAAVALERQGRKFIGGDIDPACVKIARRRVLEATGHEPTTPIAQPVTNQSPDGY